jgi:hypothetical protein
MNGLVKTSCPGDHHAASRLADLLERRGDVDELRARADAGDSVAAPGLAELMAEGL